ncbi:MAG: DUF5106 domain-containing protein [Rikenellaceae bacterium]
MLVLCSCNNASNNSSQSKANEVKQQYLPPQAPSMLSSQNERNTYIAKNFWSKFDFQDTTQIQSKVLEQAFVDFLYAIANVPTFECAEQSIRTFMEGSSVDSVMLEGAITISEKYLYDPNSPMRNEDLYICVLEYIVNSPKVDELNKIRPEYQLEMALKNRVGTIATDFIITTDKKEQIKLSEIKAEHILLLFNNPDCPDCLRVKETIESKNELFSNVKIVSVYTDSDLTIWKNTNYPKKWLNGYDKNCIITKQKLYDLKAIPTLYLLNHELKVILKDAPIDIVLRYLNNHNNNI